MSLNDYKILAILLSVVALGSTFNYIRLKVSIMKHWKLADPSIPKSELRKLLGALHEVESAGEKLNEIKEIKKDIEEAQEEIGRVCNSYEERIVNTLMNFNRALKNYVDVTKKLYDYAESRNYKDMMSVFDSLTSEFDKSFMLLQESEAMWPELIISNIVKEDTENDTKV